tara:strand:+ start:277 stop:1332 length:1056 start_codon:yes stop_codon:yes gene_type:complete
MKIIIETFLKILGFFLSLLFFGLILALISNFIIKGNEGSYFSFYSGNKESNQKIAILNLSGPIISEPINFNNFKIFQSLEVIYPSIIKEYLKELEEKNVLALIVSINSPGGSVSASHKIYELIKEFKEKNDLLVYFHTSELLASGGYWVALSGDKIFANYGSVIGSIGVKGPDWIYYNSPTSINGIFGSGVESPNGIQLYSNSAGLSKDIFNPFRKPQQDEILKLQMMVDKIYEDFVDLVVKNRKVETEIVTDQIGAMIFNSKDAKSNFLIDNELYIEDVIDILSKKLQLNSKKIIINNKKKSYLENLELFSFFEMHKPKDKYLSIINKKFCNNLYNGFSSVLINSRNQVC